MRSSTDAPWKVHSVDETLIVGPAGEQIATTFQGDADYQANHEKRASDARLIAAAPDLESEMRRFLPIIERAEADPEIWERLTAGLGIATANAYRYALAKADRQPPACMLACPQGTRPDCAQCSGT